MLVDYLYLDCYFGIQMGRVVKLRKNKKRNKEGKRNNKNNDSKSKFFYLKGFKISE